MKSHIEEKVTVEGNIGVYDSEDVLDVQDLEEEANENEDVDTPQVGMIFNSNYEAYDYYKRFGKSKGFGILRRTCKLDDNKMVKYMTYSCAKSRDRKCDSNPRPNPTTKTDCKASVNFVVDVDGRYRISRVKLEHNHALSPSKARFLRCNKEMNLSAKKRLELNDKAGISISKTFNSFVVEAGGFENLTFGERECRNYIAKARKTRLGVGDAEAIYSYFVRMKNKNAEFFYNIEFDDENRMKNIFWADARSRAAYESFGDVITFDTTYLTNKYDMPFAPFVGINHHGQSILLGCGLLSHEDTETYSWLFRSWLECMNGVAPNGIVTDQCKAIKGAIVDVFPKARHRLCLWHIMSKIPSKLSGYAYYNSISLCMMDIVYESMTPNDFEVGWAKMINLYNLHNNEWLKLLYNDRHLWVPAYMKDAFWAGMSTTQRSESMNSFFDGYINPKTTLKQFVEQYDNALRGKVEKENHATFVSFNSCLPLITNFKFEKQFQEAYTIEMFKKVQEELRGLYYCNVSFVKTNGSILIFQVRENLMANEIGLRKLKVYEVFYNETEFEVKCICGLFEVKGVICRHAISVLTDQCVQEIPSRYILDRWRKDVKRRYTNIRSSFDNNQNFKLQSQCPSGIFANMYSSQSQVGSNSFVFDSTNGSQSEFGSSNFDNNRGGFLAKDN